jgi:hypothetical protein
VEEGGESFHDTETVGGRRARSVSMRLDEREAERKKKDANSHRNRQREPHRKHRHKEEDRSDSLHLERAFDGHVPQDLGELSVREGERPETKVGGGVGDATEAELDRVCSRRLKDEYEKKIKGREDVRMTW